MSGWQPIETAPKDGTEFLAALSNGQVTMLYAPMSITLGHRFSWWSGGRSYSIPYVPSHKQTDWGDRILATHWMPLPAPPKTA